MTDLLERPAPPPVDPRFVRRWVDARRQEGRRRLRLLAGVAAVVAVLAAAVGVLYSPLMEVRHVRVAVSPASASGPFAPSPATLAGLGLGPPGPRALRRLGGLQGSPLMVDVDTAAVVRHLDAVPELGAARVAKQWPSTVSVSVDVRSPLAVVASGRPGAPWALVDRTGRVLADAPDAPPGLPQISMGGPVPAPGGWLAGTPGPAVAPTVPAGGVDTSAVSDGPDVPLGPAAALAVIDLIPPALRGDVVSVTTSPELALVVTPPRVATGTIVVRLGDGSQLAAKVTALLTLLQSADLSGVTVFDLTVPSRPAASVRAG